jgi:hypothetical protein
MMCHLHGLNGMSLDMSIDLDPKSKKKQKKVNRKIIDGALC